MHPSVQFLMLLAPSISSQIAGFILVWMSQARSWWMMTICTPLSMTPVSVRPLTWTSISRRGSEYTRVHGVASLRTKRGIGVGKGESDASAKPTVLTRQLQSFSESSLWIVGLNVRMCAEVAWAILPSRNH